MGAVVFEQIFLSADAVRDLVFGLFFTLVAFYIGQQSGKRRERQIQRGFVRQLVSIQSAIHDLANDDAFWTTDTDKSKVRVVFRPLSNLLTSVNSAAGDADVAANVENLGVALRVYKNSFDNFVDSWEGYQRRAKGYRELNDEMVEALILVVKKFDWRVRWGFVKQLRDMKLATGKKYGAGAWFSQN